MKKLSLNLDALCVESFETLEASAERGTVAANAPTNGRTCPATCYTCGVNPNTTNTARLDAPTVDCPLCV
ncbi:MAG TPA: hypothetical protein VF746_15040 [Longimicrobium sp.]|jgi:hypothetical protein